MCVEFAWVFPTFAAGCPCFAFFLCRTKVECPSLLFPCPLSCWLPVCVFLIRASLKIPALPSGMLLKLLSSGRQFSSCTCFYLLLCHSCPLLLCCDCNQRLVFCLLLFHAGDNCGVLGESKLRRKNPSPFCSNRSSWQFSCQPLCVNHCDFPP